MFTLDSGSFDLTKKKKEKKYMVSLLRFNFLSELLRFNFLSELLRFNFLSELVCEHCCCYGIYPASYYSFEFVIVDMINYLIGGFTLLHSYHLKLPALHFAPSVCSA